MLPHLHDLLVTELRSPQYDGLSPNEAYRKASSYSTLQRLGSYRFLTTSEYEALPEKQRPELVVLIPEELLVKFIAEAVLMTLRLLRRKLPNNVPGFPNKLKRPDFDRAWSEARPL